MQEQPLISVVIPAYNRADTIERALDSVRAQNFRDMEIIVVDNCSEDDTVVRVKAWAGDQPSFKLIRHDRNKGEAGSRNSGVRAARGRYVAFLDSDDEWLPGKLQCQLDALAKAGPSVTGCFTGQYIVMENGEQRLIDDWSVHLPITDLNLLTLGCGVGMGTTLMVERSAFEAAGYFDEELPLFVDVDWLCRYVRAQKVIKIPQPLTRYHKSPIRRGEVMERATALYVAKSAQYFASFGFVDRRRIMARLHSYISQSYEVHGPLSRFLSSRGRLLLAYPLQPPAVYIHWLAALLGLVRIGERSGR
jgi:glycosyltransferase involved in cell wall biosynthesis